MFVDGPHKGGDEGTSVGPQPGQRQDGRRQAVNRTDADLGTAVEMRVAFGQQHHPEPGGDRLEDGIGCLGGRADDRRPAVPLRCGDPKVPQGSGLGWQGNDRFLEQVGEGNPFLPCQRMVGRQRDTPPFPDDGEDVKIVGGRGQPQEGDVAGSVVEPGATARPLSCRARGLPWGGRSRSVPGCRVAFPGDQAGRPPSPR